jgi:type 2 lantibiotic biosynthesis protein LanM
VAADRVLQDDWWRLGLTARERLARPLTPAWAVDAARALASAPDTPLVTRTFASWQEGYGEVLRPLVKWATGLVPTGPGVADFARQLQADLVDLAARTLTLELHHCRAAGTLTGESGAERFVDFVRRMRRPDQIAAVFVRYPVLARLLLVACRSAADAYTEMVRRFESDRGAVIHRFFGGTDPGDLAALDLCRGDRHRGGRSVSILEFQGGGRLVYKPRSLAACGGFSRLAAWLNDRVPELELRTAQVLERGEYGWQEYIPALPCADLSDVRRFYRRLGALLALLYAVHASDVHYGNLIARADQPVPIDLETLLHPDVLDADVARDPAARLLASSVYRAGVLPTFLVGDSATLDISALGGDPGRPHPVDAVDWIAPATDSMRLVRRPRLFAGAGNRPTVDGRIVEPADHVHDLLDGFQAGYDAIAAERESFLDAVSRMEPAETRTVLRPTQVYQTLLNESTHPELLLDATARDTFFELLWTSSGEAPTQKRAVPYEIADLWQGDVPIFLGHPDSVHLRTAHGALLRGALRTSGRDSVIAKVRAMGRADRGTQSWVVRAALSTRRRSGDRPTDGPLPGDPLDAARAIGDQLCDLAAVDGSRANWLGVEPSGDRLMVMPMGATLVYGYTGVALFLAQLADLTGVRRYETVAHLALGGIPQLLSATTGRPDLIRAVGCGGYDGFGGIAYALARVAALTGDERARRWAHQTVELAAGAFGETDPPGIADGHAGCLLAMTAVHADLDHAPAAELAARCADLLTGLVDDESRRAALASSGFARGAVGIGWALHRYAAAIGAPRYAQAADTVLTWCGSEHVDPAVDPAFEPGGGTGVPTPALGNGLAGAGYHLLQLVDPQRVPSVVHLEPSTTAAPTVRLMFARPALLTPREQP